MKEVNDIKWFIVILSIGNILYLVGNLLFKFIGLYVFEQEIIQFFL